MPSQPEPVDVIVIGGGMSGLAAARELSRQRLRVVLVEARARMGGRIDTRRPKDWPLPVELGAEFIHGGNPDLWTLVKAARVTPRKLADRHWLSREGVVEKIPDVDRKLSSVTRLIKPAKASGLSFTEYFRKYPARVAPDDWMLARSFVEGFEAAPRNRISARSLAGEAMDDRDQYVVPGGYDQVIARLVDDCARGGVRMLREMVVTSVAWRRGRVSVAAHDALSGVPREYTARATIVALPLGVLKARSGTGAVRFNPALKGKQALIDGMQMGEVFRIAIRFHRGSWRRMLPEILQRGRNGFGFIHSTAKGVPVWWSLSGQPVVVGWAGGPAAKALLRIPIAARRRKALSSLAETLGIAPSVVKQGVADWKSWDWTNDPFTRGAYSFTAAGQDESGTKLRRPLRDTLFFAGEATADGSEVGTVHGALSSGLRAAREAARVLGRTRRRRA
jgi:monoamine oxidase